MYHIKTTLSFKVPGKQSFGNPKFAIVINPTYCNACCGHFQHRDLSESEIYPIHGIPNSRTKRVKDRDVIPETHESWLSDPALGN